MAKARKKPVETPAAETTPVSAETAVDTSPLPAEELPADQLGTAGESVAPTSRVTLSERSQEERKPIITPDPRPVMSMSLDDTKGSPRIQLLRSHRFKQMQIRFDQQPDEKYLVMLKNAGWRDRTEEEGIWTIQVPDGEWRPVADAERVFKQIGNSIRKDKGLEPLMVAASDAPSQERSGGVPF